MHGINDGIGSRAEHVRRRVREHVIPDGQRIEFPVRNRYGRAVRRLARNGNRNVIVAFAQRRSGRDFYALRLAVSRFRTGSGKIDHRFVRRGKRHFIHDGFRA